MSDLMKIGADWGSAGVFKPLTAGISGGQRILDAHGRFFDTTLAGRTYSGGTPTLLAINNATFSVATLGATATPLIGIWNPATSLVNLVILQANLYVVMTAVAATGPGGFFWAASVGNAAISTGSIPFNRKTLVAAGSSAKFFPGTALTGLTNNLVVIGGSSLSGGSAENVTFTATAVAMQTQAIGSVENIDGSIVVPPGGVLALLTGTTPVAHSIASSIMWEEVPAGMVTL